MQLVLQTRRLRLRRLTFDDAGLMLAIWNDPAFIENVSDRGIRTVDEARTAMSNGVLKLYDDYGYGPYRVALKADDTAIGICGIFRREGLDEPDIGFALLPEFCAHGYAHEAAVAVVDHARDDLGLARLVAIVSPENAPSIGLISKLGLQFERMMRLPGEDADVAVYGISLKGN